MTWAIISMSQGWVTPPPTGRDSTISGSRRTKFGMRQGTQPDRTTTFLRLISHLCRIRPGALIGRLGRKWPAPIGFWLNLGATPKVQKYASTQPLDTMRPSRYDTVVGMSSCRWYCRGRKLCSTFILSLNYARCRCVIWKRAAFAHTPSFSDTLWHSLIAK
jgi:hypothetical protein